MAKKSFRLLMLISLLISLGDITSGFTQLRTYSKGESLGNSKTSATSLASVGNTILVSASLTGLSGNGISHTPSISGDGRFVAFASAATNLVTGDTNGFDDIFLCDIMTGKISRISHSFDNKETNGSSIETAISSDGRFIAFSSGASNIVPFDTNGKMDVFLYDKDTGQIQRASLSPSGEQLNSSSINLSISADGRFVAFSTYSTNQVGGNYIFVEDVYLFDRQKGYSKLISQSTSGSAANDISDEPSLSADGQILVFASAASNLVSNDSNGVWDVFVYDQSTTKITRISTSSSGAQSNGASGSPSVSADGRYVTFNSSATNLVAGDTNGYGDIFIHDRIYGDTKLVSEKDASIQANSASQFSSVSLNGRYVAYGSAANNLVTGDTNQGWDVFVRDMQTGINERISVASDGSQGLTYSVSPRVQISNDGRLIVFEFVYANLVSGDKNGVTDVFLRDRCTDGSCVTQGLTIEGFVKDPAGNSIPDVTVSAGVGKTATTSATGAYSILGLVAGNYSLVAFKDGYFFSPISRNVTVPPNSTGQDFTGLKPDFSVSAIEITQGIQDITNSVPLIEAKRTYARVYVQNLGDSLSNSVTAKLCKNNDCLEPNNIGKAIQIQPNADRGSLDQSFYFELPPSWLHGAVILTSEVNPTGPKHVEEINTSNNSMAVQVTFNSVPPLLLRLINVRYGDDSKWYEAESLHLDAIESWLKRAYPINDLFVNRSSIDFSGIPFDGLTGGIQVQSRLQAERNINQLFGEDPRTKYYGVVDDGGTLIRGIGLLSVAVGPTGNPADYPNNILINWDHDNSFGDWYAGHEIGHTLGLWHAPCNVESPPWEHYPYPNGLIGGLSTDPSRFYGFDVQARVIYGPTWHDMMSYCPNQWISDYNYKNIFNNIPKTNSATNIKATEIGEFVIINGAINNSKNITTLNTLYRIPDVNGPTPPLSGSHSIKLIGSGETILAEYPFTPSTISDSQPGDDEIAMISETVPWVEGTQRVAIYSGSQELVSRLVSAHSPVVNLLSPQGGDSFSDTMTVTWNSSDDDHDPLEYVIQYSVDGGINWQVIASGISDSTTYKINTSLLPGTDKGKIRVIASDGINTGFAESSSLFTIAKKPPVAKIISPASGASYFPGQTIILNGMGYDVEDGTLPDSALTWSSSKSGLLGTGRMLDARILPLSSQVITLTVTDSDGNSTTSSIELFAGYQGYVPIIRK